MINNKSKHEPYINEDGLIRFTPAMMGKSELACMYFDNIEPESATRELNRCIKRYHGLWEALVREGYVKNAKRFTPNQVKLIVLALGAPPYYYYIDPNTKREV